MTGKSSRCDGKPPHENPWSGIVLIDIEGTDGSGKETQSLMLVKKLRDMGFDAVDLHFPRYGNRSAALVEDYLAGRFGDDPNQVNPYAASMLYAADRWAAFHEKSGPIGKRCTENGGPRVVVCDRYTASNAVFQCAKLPGDERPAMLEWLESLEFGYLGQPEPDAVVFLDADPDVVRRVLAGRDRTGSGNRKAGVRHDIHERNDAYIRHCRDVGLEIAAMRDWHVVRVTKDGAFRALDDIHADILRIATAAIAAKTGDRAETENTLPRGARKHEVAEAEMPPPRVANETTKDEGPEERAVD